ncbi:hypothetical protein BO70DRAFT_428517 [Aspergillus heteromorphus CBS 117.55]|uniref:tRNA(Ile)-lysidine synthetase n=1 Tax=Aspergillus heteromorphus CBS 117.55 TaxID=1448321 RepID=A0A317WIN3_9EURO|nr:uncharacterized protein BO70DRAFT_428517 [Aspergillus heteromorphus CBS 117.55]PWY84928.1 hypothetical protein BO70DRAFT_428517 [Aspergillus heteromorphus CBS 117.55]
MAASHLLRHTTPGAITIKQFLDSFHRIWLEARPARTGRKPDARLPSRLGLAVSGGADSMALAHLCRQWEKGLTNAGDDNDLSVTAFVVDHQAREESTREANQVAGWLDDMGLKTQILKLEWPEMKTSAFETHARRLRFQALGQACRAQSIDTLLMGHHQDDNVETTLWRLCTGARGAGLAGIPPVTRIPECHGLFGIAESGSSVVLRSKTPSFKITHANELQPSPLPENQEDDIEYRISTGGISICRPLLSFPKANLLATCHENNIPFVSDPTNFDPTLTPRNAIRRLLAEGRLPRALQAPSILSLVQKSNALLQSSTDASNDLLQQCTLFSFSPSTGSMILQFPEDGTNPPQFNPQIQSLTLRRITEFVSPFPENQFPLRSFEPFISRVFPSAAQTSDSTSTSKRQPFTLGGVMFQPLKWTVATANPALKHKQNPTSDTTTTTTTTLPKPNTAPQTTKNKKSETETHLHTGNGNTWLLTRQPYMRNPLTTLLNHLSRTAPGQVRFTLPVLVLRRAGYKERSIKGNREEKGKEEEEEIPIAFPTLDLWIPGSETLQELSSWEVQWEWMYKSVDREGLGSMKGLDSAWYLSTITI